MMLKSIYHLSACELILVHSVSRVPRKAITGCHWAISNLFVKNVSGAAP